jgi:hypothetical protein
MLRQPQNTAWKDMAVEWKMTYEPILPKLFYDFYRPGRVLLRMIPAHLSVSPSLILSLLQLLVANG